MRRQGNSKGFTLVELLVVIAIIGVLVALLLPAVQAAREAARRMQCTNNLKQWALCLQNHHDARKQLPAASYSSPTANRQSWPPQLWPFIEATALADQYDYSVAFYAVPNCVANSTNSPVATPLPAYYCPSDRGSPAYAKGNTFWSVRGNYALNWGPVPFCLPQGQPTPTAYAPFGFRDFNPCSANSNSHAAGAGRAAPRRSRFKDFTDGASKTLLISEKIMHPTDAVLDLRGSILNDDGGGNVFSTVSTPNSSDVDFTKPGFSYCTPSLPELPCEVGTTTNGYYESARSRHTGGVLAGMADGSVHFFAETVALNLWQDLSTMNDGKTSNENWNP